MSQYYAHARNDLSISATLRSKVAPFIRLKLKSKVVPRGLYKSIRPYICAYGTYVATSAF